jgi:carbamoyl-phosphate synthase small subunit
VLPQLPQALLALADGTVFRGSSIGAAGHTVGEVVFNTSLTGYQEILTDPSYCRQIVTLTYPHIGNVGVNPEDIEATKVHAAGLIIKDLPVLESNFRMTQTLPQYLQEQGTVAIAGIDTRRLTRILRTSGAQNGCILALPAGEALTQAHTDQAIAQAKAAASMSGQDLAKEVSTGTGYDWTESEWKLGTGYGTQQAPRFHVVAYDFGVKRNILRMLAERGCKVTVLPAKTPAAEALKHKPDGIFLSNGPGDPAGIPYASTAVNQLLETHVPTFGICLGHQIIGRALGAQTYKLKFGHHGGNQPVSDNSATNVQITSQNHNYAVDAAGLPGHAEITHLNLNDGTVEGLRLTDRPVFCVQYHPEASPGPHDADLLFARFAQMVKEHAAAKRN